MTAADEAVRRERHRVREERPWLKADVHEKRVRAADPRGESGEPAEKDREQDRGRERLDDGPCGAKYGLLVADLDVAPDEKKQQLAVPPQLARVERLPRPRRLDTQPSGDRVFGLDGIIVARGPDRRYTRALPQSLERTSGRLSSRRSRRGSDRAPADARGRRPSRPASHRRVASRPDRPRPHAAAVHA